MRQLAILIVILTPYFTNGQGYGAEFKPGHSDDCHRAVTVIPIIKSLDSNNDSLKIDFVLFDSDTTNIFPITGLMATKGINPKNFYAGDSLVFRIENASGVDSISFPQYPTSFIEKTTKKDRPRATYINKQGEYDFYFKTPMSCYGGHWHYDPRFGDKEFRWLFTKDGYYKPVLEISYNEWVKNDHLEIFLNERRLIDETSFKILDVNGHYVDFELVTKKNPTRTIILNLSRDFKQSDKLIVLVSSTIIKGDVVHESFFKYPLDVRLTGSVGFGGKYNNLER
jgi:hypothetical protein